MRTRLMTIAALLPIASIGQSEPAKAPASQSVQPHYEPSKALLLAAADTAKATASDANQTVQTQPRRRVGRVTTCRCGDPAPGDTTGENPER